MILHTEVLYVLQKKGVAMTATQESAVLDEKSRQAEILDAAKVRLDDLGERIAPGTEGA